MVAMREKARRQYEFHRRTMICVWVLGRLEDAALQGCDAYEHSIYQLTDQTRGMYGLIKYVPHMVPTREQVIETLKALGLEERAEQVADVLRAM